MYYKQYGDTDMKVSAVGFGAMRFDPELVAEKRFEECAEVLLYAHSKGINYIDTAPFYCQDNSEAIVGIALKQLKRDSFYISSKTHIKCLDGELTRDSFYRRLDQTLTRLNVDYLDIYNLWNIKTLDSYEREMEIIYPCLEDAKRQGLVKNIAFSAHMDGEDLLTALADNKFKGLLIGYNALNYRFRQAGIKEAYDKGMGLCVMNPLGGGLIANNPDMFKYLANGTDLTPAQAALRFVAQHKEISIALNGMTYKSHVDDALVAIENLVEFSASEIYEQHKNSGLEINNLCTGCGYCKHCPVDVPIPQLMDAYNCKILGINAIGRMKNHWAGLTTKDAEKCISCGKCETLCTQKLPIVERLAEIANWE